MSTDSTSIEPQLQSIMATSGPSLLPMLGRIGSVRGSSVLSSSTKPLMTQRPAIRIRCFATTPSKRSSDVESEKYYESVDEAVADIKSGSTILSAGFGLCGTAGE